MLATSWGIQFPIEEVEAYRQLCAEYDARQERNLRNSLRPSDRLDIRSRYTFSYLLDSIYPTDKNHNIDHIKVKSEHTRSRITLFDTSAFNHLDIILTAPVRTGRGYFSQVWTASVSGKYTVVVKVFLGCFGPTPEWFDAPDPALRLDFVAEDEMAHREAWAYTKLTDIQGSRIPHSYGFFLVRT